MRTIKSVWWGVPTRVFAILIFLAMPFLAPTLSFAEEVGRVSRVIGRVDVLRAGATATVPARQGDGVSMGDIIRTKSDGKAEILFKDDTTVTVAPETRLKIDEYTFNPDNSRSKGILSLFRGKIRAAVSKVKGGLIPVSIWSSTFNINTPTTVAGVRGTVLFVFYDRGITGVVFKEGNGFVYNKNMPDRMVNVSAGQATFILKGNAPPLPPKPASDVEMSQHIKDTTIKETNNTPNTNSNDIDNNHTDTKQTETTHVDTADTKTTLGQTGGEDTSVPKTTNTDTDTEVEPSTPPPVLPITETDTETLKDIVPPLITITSSPATVTNSSTADFGVSISETSTYTYTLDGATVASTSLTGLTEGPHTFVVTATDAAGNVSTNTYTWTTDYTAPTTPTLSNVPSSITNINTATIGATATDAHTITYIYTLDGVAVPNGNLTGLTEGPHTFIVTATDAAGNSSTSNYAWTTDYTAPVASLTPSAVPEAGMELTTVNLNMASNEPSAFAYSLDGGALTATGASLSLAGTPEGSHTLNVQTTDLAGNTTSNFLSFDLSRYSLTGSVADLSGGAFGSASGEVAGISNQNWGGWIIDMSGNSGGILPATFTIVAGGASTDTTLSNNGGYWIDIINGASDGISALSGTSSFKYLSYDRLGTGTGISTGSYDGSGNFNLTDAGNGTYTETPLAWSGNVATDSNGAALYSMNTVGPWLDIEGNSTGLMGGIASPWTGASAVSYMGNYDVSLGIAAGSPYLWTPKIYSYNVNNSTNTTFDGGAYGGFIGGVWEQDGTIEATVYSLYIDPSGNAGILKGSVTGSYYPDLSMFEADGTWTPTLLATGLNATTASLNAVSTNYGYRIRSSGNFNGSGSITVAGNEMLTATDWRLFISGQDWGIRKSIIGGAYTDPTSDTWSLSTTVPLPTTIYGTQTEGNQWSNGVLAGQTYGYGADISTTPMTWISVGETIGTFDAAALTWQAVQTSSWLNTNKFLAMRGTPEGQAALTQLNIPFVEVGKATLSGSGNNFTTLAMTDTTFFAYSNGAAPKIWATGNVSGNYTAPPVLNTAVTLTGSGLSADFNVRQWNTTNSNWMATVNGGGIYSGTGTMNGTSVQMTGASAGTGATAGTGSITGTGAGVAK